MGSSEFNSSKGVPSCWEYWNCAQNIKEKCYVYQKDLGGYCWALSSIIDKNEVSPFKQKKFNSCLECPWYEKVIHLN